jgi:hypothetical protein
MWVDTQLTEGKENDPAAIIYSDLINTATDALILDRWAWICDSAVRLVLPEQFVEGVNLFWNRVQRALWYGKYPALEISIKNLSHWAGQYVHHFAERSVLKYNDKQPGKGFYFEDKSWKSYAGKNYDKFANEANKWQTKSLDLLSNLVVALNEFASAVRTYMNPHYLIYQGLFLINDDSGVLSENGPAIYKPETYVDID